MKERKKETVRAHNAQAHAALSVAAVAAAVAAIITASSTSSSASSSMNEMQNKKVAALASAAALVAAQCVEMAEWMGADRHQLSSLVSSAVCVKSSGDLTTLTASAATGTYIFAASSLNVACHSLI